MDPRLMIVLAGVGAAASMQSTIGEHNAARRANDFRYTPDPRVVRVLAGSDTSTVADLIWLGALPDMSRPFEDLALKKRWIAAATDVVTDLEPAFGTVYGFGAAHLNLVDRNPDAAIALIEKGIRLNPDSAGLHVLLAMQYYEYKKDKPKTIELLEKASTMPDIDSLSLAMLSALKVDARDDFMAIATWAKALEDAHAPAVKATCEYELWRTKLLVATRAAREFETKHGRAPATVDEICVPELMSANVIDVIREGLTLDPKGRARYAKLDELTRANLMVQAVSWVEAFRAGNDGRIPTEEEFFRLFGGVPEPPAGKRWKYADGRLTLEEQR